jgi:hypothetical protein
LSFAAFTHAVSHAPCRLARSNLPHASITEDGNLLVLLVTSAANAAIEPRYHEELGGMETERHINVTAALEQVYFVLQEAYASLTTNKRVGAARRGEMNKTLPCRESNPDCSARK